MSWYIDLGLVIDMPVIIKIKKNLAPISILCAKRAKYKTTPFLMYKHGEINFTKREYKRVQY